MKSTPATRPLVTVGRKVPSAIAHLLKDEGFCSRVGAAWPQIKAVILEIQSNLAGFTTEHALAAGPTVLATNAVLKTFEVFHDQAESDKIYRESTPGNPHP